MTYNTDNIRTAGKITVYTTFVGVVAFALIFIFNIGSKEITKVDAQSTATTSVTVVNTPPQWTVDAEELVGSSTTTPTNAGDVVSWTAVGTDANSEDYYLLLCSTNATPTAHSSAAPDCGAGATQWAVSTATISALPASVSTTTLAAWSESNVWYAFICDGSPSTPRCHATAKQGTGTTSSPFEVNHRPTFTAYTDDSPMLPGQSVTFTSTSADTDVSGTADTVLLFVCATSGFNTVTNTCTGTTLASTTVAGMTSDATASYTIVIPTQDQNYSAYGYVIDSHGFEATGGSQDTDSTLSVGNASPTVDAATISINGGGIMSLVTEAGQTTGYSLSFSTADNNSCDAVGGGTGDEVTGYALSLYRSGIGSTTCSSLPGAYNANNCYPSGLATSTWNLNCTASTTSCSGSSDTDMEWNCTFPLWYIADPTDGSATTTQYSAQDWRALIAGVDNNAATGSSSESTLGVDVASLLAFALNTPSIPYGSLEPGQQTDPLVATTTIAATGNVGVDKDVTGSSMCETYSPSSPCANSATSTIPESEQVVATSTTSYAAAASISSTTPLFVNLNVNKSTSTSTPSTKNAYWGIRIPGTISYAGSYTGQNTFTAVLSNSSEWFLP